MFSFAPISTVRLRFEGMMNNKTVRSFLDTTARFWLACDDQA
jgi:hypothetical protein